MAIYNFLCNKCHKAYEELASYDETGKYPTVKCPACGSKKKKKTPSLVSIGHTSSKMDNFEYRAGYNYAKASDERRLAEEFSHVGANPYSEIDDISSGEHFGEIR